MRITTRYYRAKWDDDPYRSKIKAFSEKGHSLTIWYPYECDDPHWKAAYSLAKALNPELEDVALVGETPGGYVYATHFGNGE